MRSRIGAAVVAAGLMAGQAHGQQKIEWKQVSNVPVGLNLPADVSADILGIRLGESYAVVKPKLEAIKEDREGVDGEPRLEESGVSMNAQTEGGNWIEAEWPHPGTIKLTRDTKGTELVVGSSETIWVQFTAPSSGSQATEIHRLLKYNEQHRQVRIAEIVKDLSAKFKSQPVMFTGQADVTYWWQFNDGQPFTSKNRYDPRVCTGAGLRSPTSTETADQINKDGLCDVRMEVRFVHGISEDHAQLIWFKLSDLERSKLNTATDQKYFDDYRKSFITGTSGKKPKL